MPKTIIVTDSQYAGEYLVYDIDSDNSKDLPKHRDIENNKEYTVGEWIKSYDNYIIQIIAKKEYTGMIKYWTPCGVIISKKIGRTGKMYTSKFSVCFNNLHKEKSIKVTNLGNAVDRIARAKMRLIAKGLLSGLGMTYLMKNIGKMRNVTAEKVYLLLTSEKFMTEYSAEVEDFVARVKATPDFSDDNMIKEMQMLLVNSRKGTEVHRENIKFILNITGRSNDKALTSKELRTKKIESNQPPQLRSV